MSGELAVIVAAAAGAATPVDSPALTAPAPLLAPPIAVHAISLGIPSTDGLRGAQVTYEHWFPDQRLAFGFAGELRNSATGDYTGLRVGGAFGIRKYWKADAWLSKLPRGSMVGWFVGAAAHLDGNFTHDDVASRWLGSTLQFGVSSEVGYRIAPWRGLIITPTAGAEWHHDFDISGRLPGWNKLGVIAGLEVGWLF